MLVTRAPSPPIESAVSLLRFSAPQSSLRESTMWAGRSYGRLLSSKRLVKRFQPTMPTRLTAISV